MAMIMCVGLDENLYSSARIEGQIDRTTAIVTLGSRDLSSKLGEIAESSGAREEKIVSEQAFVIFDGPQSALDSVMKGFKKAYKLAAGSIIFAMLTETARTWTLQDYLAELSAEHREMRKSSAKGNVKSSAKMLHEKEE